MNPEAVTMMIGTFTIVGGTCAYFFFRVLTAKPEREPDSYTDDDESR